MERTQFEIKCLVVKLFLLRAVVSEQRLEQSERLSALKPGMLSTSLRLLENEIGAAKYQSPQFVMSEILFHCLSCNQPGTQIFLCRPFDIRKKDDVEMS